MYEKNYTSIFKNHFEVRIPNWFLREKGVLIRDINISGDFIEMTKNGLKIRFCFSTKGTSEFVLGNFRYLLQENYLDFQSIISNPLLWIGNKKLSEFAGHSIFNWIRKNREDRI